MSEDHDRDIFLLAYSASLLLFKLGTEFKLYDNDAFKCAAEILEKIKCMTSKTYDEIARGISSRAGEWEDNVKTQEETK